MKKLRSLFGLLVLASLLLLVAQNTAPVETRFLWYSAEMSGIVLLLLTAAGGFVLGLLAAWLGRRRRNPR